MMTIEKLISFRVIRVKSPAHLFWAENMIFNLPSSILIETGLTKYIDRNGNMELNERFQHIPSKTAQKLRMLAAYTNVKPMASRFPFSYQIVPPKMRTIIAAFIGRSKQKCLKNNFMFPSWPLDLSSDYLADLASEAAAPFADGPTPVILTHDIDSEEGLNNLINMFLEIEESVGAHSTNFIVPSNWPINLNQIDYLVERGHELGIHGYNHANLTPFCSSKKRKARLKNAEPLIERYNIKGYRAPSLLRTQELLQDLKYFYQYDSSIPSSGGLFPVPGNGCASARPFALEGIAELPISLPRDGSLRFMGYSANQILDLWRECAEYVSRSGGVVVLLTHCEKRFSGNPEMLNAYRKFVEYVTASKAYEWSRPDIVLRRYGL